MFQYDCNMPSATALVFCDSMSGGKQVFGFYDFLASAWSLDASFGSPMCRVS